MQADEDWDALLPMPPEAAPGIAAHHGVDAAWPFPAFATPVGFAAFDSPAAMEQDQEGATRGSTGAVLGDALAARLELDDAALAAAAVDDDNMPIPAQIHVDRQGKVGVCKNVAFCSQAGWKEGCVGGVGEFRGGNDKHNTRYRYECLSCNSWWSQIRPDRLQPGQDPEIRPVVFNEKRRAYRCGKCRLFCVPAKAAAAGEMRYCTCPRSEKTKRHKVPASMQCAMLIDSLGENDTETLGLPSLAASGSSDQSSRAEEINRARAAAHTAIRISSSKPMRGGGSPIEPVQAAPVLATAVVQAVAAPPPTEPVAVPAVETPSAAAEAPTSAPPEPREKPVSKIRIVEQEMDAGGRLMTREITTVRKQVKPVVLPPKARSKKTQHQKLTPHQRGLPFMPKQMLRDSGASRISKAGEKRYREEDSGSDEEPELAPTPAPETEPELAPAPEPEPNAESDAAMEDDGQAPPLNEANCRCFKCRRVLDDHNGQTIEPCIPCSRCTCDTWSCFKCAGFKTRAQMSNHKGAWYCCSKKRK